MHIIPIPAFNDNYLWLLHDDQFAAAVDPGDATPILQILKQKKLTLTHILVTHHHMDHVGGIRTLKAHFPNVIVYGPNCGRISCIDHAMTESDQIDLHTLGKYQVIEVPGHTSSHLAYFGEQSLFIGDTVFAAGCGRLFEGTPKQMVNSFEKIKKLPVDTKIYCAHEYTLSNLKFARTVDPNNEALKEREIQCLQMRKQGLPTVPFTLAEELQCSPFFRYDALEIQKAASQKAGKNINTSVETFTVIRSWKDSF